MTDRTPTLFLHIGAMKTGTTYLQQVLGQNKQALARRGVLFPGDTWADQVRAAHDALGHHREKGVRERAAGAWPALVREVRSWTGPSAVVSVEFLSFADARAARRIVGSLEGLDVQVVLSVRDTSAVLPGLWQTHCANGGTASWPAFARSARAGASTGPVAPLLGQGSRLFRRALDVPRMLEVWSETVPRERLHVVTVPRAAAAPDQLWERFAAVLGVEAGAATEPAQNQNPSLGYPSAELMRRLNAELGRLPRERYNPTLKHVLAEKVLAARTAQEGRACLDAPAARFAAHWNRRVRAALEASGAHLVGDLDDLPVTEPADTPPPIEPPSEADLLAAAETAAEGLASLAEKRIRRLGRRAEGPAPGGQPLAVPEVDPAGWRARKDPVAAAVRDLARTARLAMDVHDRLRSARMG